MNNVENIYEITLQLLPEQLDLILKSIELYAFNFHNTWSVNIDSEEEERRNAIIFYTYQTILSKYNSKRARYDVLYSCRLKHRRDRIRNFKKLKKSA